MLATPVLQLGAVFPPSPANNRCFHGSTLFGASLQPCLPLFWPSQNHVCQRGPEAVHAGTPLAARSETTPSERGNASEAVASAFWTASCEFGGARERRDGFLNGGQQARKTKCSAFVAAPATPERMEDVEENGEVLIECKDVYKSFGDKHILRGASFKIRHGEAVGIIGPSGTGKSTILRIMAGLLEPDKGEVWICGKKREGLISDEDNPPLRIGMVFQSAALFDSLTVRENVGFMLYEHSDIPEDEIKRRVTESLKQVGLYNVEQRLPSELSGGMKKRVALARAIISDAQEERSSDDREVVMYDEPTAGLDPIASTVVEDLIRSLHVKSINPATKEPGTIASYIVVTHQHSTIRRAVDRLLFLHEGRVVWEGSTSEFDTSQEPIVRQFAEGNLKGPIRY